MSRQLVGLALFAIALVALAAPLAGCNSSDSLALTPELPSPTAAVTPAQTPAPAFTAAGVTDPDAAVTPNAQLTPAAPIQELPSGLASRVADDAIDFLRTFTEEASPRASATEDERAAADVLSGEFESIGFNTDLQTFTFSTVSSDIRILTPQSGESLEIFSLPMSLSGQGLVSSSLIDGGKAVAEDLRPGGIGGKIALIMRGDLTFEEKVDRVAEAGALAAVVYNSQAGLFGGTLADQGRIPAISISRENGE